MSHTSTRTTIRPPTDCPLCKAPLEKPGYEIPYVRNCKNCLCFGYSRTHATYTYNIGFIDINFPVNFKTTEECEQIHADLKRAYEEGRRFPEYDEPKAYILTWRGIPEEDVESRVFELRRFADWMEDRSPLFDRNVAEVRKELAEYDAERDRLYKEKLKLETMFPKATSRGDFDDTDDEETPDSDVTPLTGEDGPVVD